MLLELVDTYGAEHVLLDLFSSYLDTDSKADFIVGFIHYWETPKDIFDAQDVKAVEEYAKVHC